MHHEGRPTSPVVCDRESSTAQTVGATRSFKRHGGALAFATIAGQVIAAISTPILGRFYGPSAYGAWALFQSIVSFGSAVGGLRYELAIPLARQQKQAVSILYLQALLSAISSGLMFVIILITRSQLEAIDGMRAMGGWLLLSPLVVGLAGLGQAATYWFIRNKEFDALAGLRLSQAIVTPASQMGFAGLSKGSPAGLVLGQACGTVAPMLLAYRVYKHVRYRLLFTRKYRRSLYRIAKRYSSFPRFIVPYGLAGILRERGLIFVVAAFSGSTALGLYTLALRVMTLPSSFISASIGPILYRKALEETDRAALSRWLARVMGLIILVCVPGFVFVSWGADAFFQVVMGHRWHGIGIYAQVLAAPGLANALQAGLDRMFDLVGRQRLALIMESTYTFVSLAFMGIGFALFHDPVVAVALFSVVTVIYHSVWIITTFRFLGLNLRDLLKTVYYLLIVGTASTLVCSALSLAIRHHIQ